MRNIFSSLHLKLDLFEGPLDVFVHLIHRKEVRSFTISLQDIFLNLRPQIFDFEGASHFLEQFTLLMLFKSRDCLPFESYKEGMDLPTPEETIHHLSDYYQFKEIACRLAEKQQEEECRYLRGTAEAIPLPPPGLEQISIAQLQALFQKMLERLPKAHEIRKDKYTVQDGKKLLLGQLPIELPKLLASIDSRPLLIVTFLALLELMKEGTLVVHSDYRVEALNRMQKKL